MQKRTAHKRNISIDNTSTITSQSKKSSEVTLSHKNKIKKKNKVENNIFHKKKVNKLANREYNEQPGALSKIKTKQCVKQYDKE